MRKNLLDPALNLLSVAFVFIILLQFDLRLFLCALVGDPVLSYIARHPFFLMAKHKDESIPAINYSLPLFLFHFIKKKLGYFVLYLIGMIIQSQHTTIYSTMFGKILDMVHPGAGFTWTNGWQHILMYGLVSIALSTCYALSAILSAQLIPWFAGEVRSYYFKYILGHSYFYFSQTLSGDILTRISNLTSSSLRIIQFVLEQGIPVMALTITVLFFFIREYHQFRYSLLAWILIHITITVARLPKYIKVSLENARQYAGLMGITGNILHNIFAIKFLYSNHFERKYFDKYQSRDIDSFRKMKFYNSITEIIMDTSSYQVFYGFVFIYQIISSYVKGTMSVGTALSTYTILRSVASQIWRTSEDAGDLMLEISRCKDAMELLTIPNSVPDSHADVSLESECEEKGQLELRNIYFYYSGSDGGAYKQNSESYLFEDLNLVIEPYSRVAFVGSSGSGKSTLTSLLLRLMDPIKGGVYLNGQDISKVGKASLRSTISFIPQREFLFNRPLFENIGYGCPEIRDEFLASNYNMDITFQNLKPETQQRIVEAAVKSESHDFIINLPKGYDSVYGSSIRLSGGQCQRIMIARAFVNEKAQFLILDEATSALDPDTEKSIQNSVRMMSEGKTVIVIAHRLNTIKDFDRIVVFEQGKIIEDGTHEDLVKMQGKYFSMWQSQTNS